MSSQNGHKPGKVLGSQGLDKILSLADFRTAYVPCFEWEDALHVRVRELTAYDRLRIYGADSELSSYEEMMELVVCGCIDEVGERLFSRDDIEKLNQRSYAPVRRLRDAIFRLSVSEEVLAKLEKLAEADGQQADLREIADNLHDREGEDDELASAKKD